MRVVEIYIARHAESQGNLEKKYFPDSGLTQNGISQANRLAEHLSQTGIDLIFASNARRAQETAEIVAKKLDLNVTTFDQLREYDRPSILMGGTVSDPKSSEFERQRALNFLNPDWKFSDDESFNELKERAKTVVNKIRFGEDKKTLLISHGTFIKTLLALMVFGNEMDVKTFWDFRHHISIPNTGLSFCTYDEKNGWKIYNIGSVV